MNAELLAKMEGLLFVVGDEGISLAELKSLIESEEEDILACLEQLKQDMKQSNRGIRLARLGNRYRLTTKVEHADLYKKLAASPIQGGLSRAALETLAIIAYKQPITRIEIDDIRGVKSDKAIQSLISKLLIEEQGRVSGTGRAILFGTTRYFLDHFNLESLEDLPSLAELDLTSDRVEEDADLFFEQLHQFEEE
ncbi:SMC-Scp complex subunit ScpB [Shouchella miscanthi]|uniref:Segregation and condensation protein B n=1 Tax=Shouchella miscanthi TaxID=2598861 RepID=A0ABU6NG21_9BACI|nr:SMC-Scp complex subunit ScpB [Shouchella miscanthi]MED4127139.1 SMC-Scp complex subunit ScpB [Shouchella miscanthi]